jgi:hypothetical protein
MGPRHDPNAASGGNVLLNLQCDPYRDDPYTLAAPMPVSDRKKLVSSRGQSH